VSRKRRAPSQSTAPIRRDYLRSLGDDIEAALALIVHDIVATGALTADEADAVVRIRASFHLEDQLENGVEPRAHETALWVAEAVQEDLIEGVGVGDRLTTWPACPDHPNHPLWLRSGQEDLARRGGVLLDDPVWTCTTTHRPVAELGQL
jgi:hypothetical protein